MNSKYQSHVSSHLQCVDNIMMGYLMQIEKLEKDIKELERMISVAIEKYNNFK